VTWQHNQTQSISVANQTATARRDQWQADSPRDSHTMHRWWDKGTHNLATANQYHQELSKLSASENMSPVFVVRTSGTDTVHVTPLRTLSSSP